MSSRRIAPQKPNRRTLRARFAGGRGFRRHLLFRYSVRTEVRDGKTQRAAETWSLESENGRSGLTKDFRFMAATGREKGSGGFMAATGREKGNGGSQETETRRDGNRCDQIASTIKERNFRNNVD